MRAHGTILLVALAGNLGCMDPLHDYDECKDIEIARCDLRAWCGDKNIESFDKAFKDFDYSTCVTYAKEHCRTREIGGTGWEQKDVAACVEAIKALAKTSCAELDRSVDETEWLPECWFIDAEDKDAGGDASSDTDTDTDTDTAKDAGADAASK